MKNILFAFLPSFLHVLFRKWSGDTIGKGVKIRFGTILRGKNIRIDNNASIGPFSYISSIDFHLGAYSNIKSLTITSAKKIDIEKYVQIASLAIITGDKTPNSSLSIGDHSRVFPFCWLDTGEGLKIGKNVGIGGHTLIFTHGVWPDYLDGGPIKFGEVIIEDNVWLPWRVFVMPGVRIGQGAIIGANSVVNKDIPANNVAAGSPAKIISESAIIPTTLDEKRKRTIEILEAYKKYSPEYNWTFENDNLSCAEIEIYTDYSANQIIKPSTVFLLFETNEETKISLQKSRGHFILHPSKEYYYPEKHAQISHFVAFLRRYGIRLYQIPY